jgi:competence protein ComEA
MRHAFLCAFAAALALTFGAPASAQRGGSSGGGTATSTPVDLNTATAAQLESLPGIGAVTALRIVEHREKNGSFSKIEELMNVRGIGEKSFLTLKPLITVSALETNPRTPASR